MKNSKVLSALLLGAAAGAILGILFAPESGAETRKKIKKKSKEFGDRLKTSINDIGENISEKFSSVKREADDLLNQKG